MGAPTKETGNHSEIRDTEFVLRYCFSRKRSFKEELYFAYLHKSLCDYRALHVFLIQSNTLILFNVLRLSLTKSTDDAMSCAPVTATLMSRRKITSFFASTSHIQNRIEVMCTFSINVP